MEREREGDRDRRPFDQPDRYPDADLPYDPPGRDPDVKKRDLPTILRTAMSRQSAVGDELGDHRLTRGPQPERRSLAAEQHPQVGAGQ